MNESKNRRGWQPVPVLVIGAVILALSVGGASAQSAAAQAQDTGRRVQENLSYSYVIPQAVWSGGAEGAQLPQDIRIMQRIVSTALNEIEPPELPEVLQQDAETPRRVRGYVSSGDTETVLWSLAGAGNRAYSIGGREVTGFYMQGYGYLFTVKWRVAGGEVAFLGSGVTAERMSELNALAGEARRAAAAREADEARAAGEAEKALEQERERLEARQAAWEGWSAQYRDMLAEGLRNVVALYGSTLKRATPDESITFIGDFGGGEGEMVTVSARRGQLTGDGLEENLAVVEMAKGETEVSDILRTELRIMAEIIDSSLQAEHTDDVWIAYAGQARGFGGDSSYQYVPGYGVLFRKAARLNLATNVVQQVAPSRLEPGVTSRSLRQRIEESTEEQRQNYAEHLAELKQKTAEIMATYGPTLTEMNGDEWVGVYYNVGSAAGLLEGGITNFLVQARMADIRQAGRETDGADWLLSRLVTNEKQN